MIITHNYYIDYMKAFNNFLLKVFNNAVGDNGILPTRFSNSIQKIEYNIGSKTLLQHKLYHNEVFEYPNLMIDLQDVRVDPSEGVGPVARNQGGLIPSSLNTFYAARNYTKDNDVYVETRRYILNFNITLNVETNADLLNYYHIITNYYPMNFTFVDYSFIYYIDITDIAQNNQWDLENDDIENIVIDNKLINPDFNDSQRVYALAEVQPEIEIESISKSEDKENMKYSLNINVLTTANIPMLIYSNYAGFVQSIVIDIDTNKLNENPIIFDTRNLINKKITKSWKNNNFNEFLFEMQDVNKIIKIPFKSKIDYENSQFALDFIEDYNNPYSNHYFIPLTDDEKELGLFEFNDIEDEDGKIHTELTIILDLNQQENDLGGFYNVLSNLKNFDESSKFSVLTLYKF